MELNRLKEDALGLILALFPPKKSVNVGDVTRSDDTQQALDLLIEDMGNGLGEQYTGSLLEEIFKAIPSTNHPTLTFCQDEPRHKLVSNAIYRLLVHYKDCFQYLELEHEKKSIIYGFEDRYIRVTFEDSAKALEIYKAIATKMRNAFLEESPEYRNEVEASLEGIPVEHIVAMSRTTYADKEAKKNGIVYAFVDDEYCLQIWAAKGFKPRPVIESGFPLTRTLGPGVDPGLQWETVERVAYGEGCLAAAESGKVSGLFRKHKGVNFSREHVDPEPSKR